MKDFYDIYLLMKLKDSQINKNVLYEAIKTTFEYRNTIIDSNEFDGLLNLLQEDEEFLSRWKNFVNKNHYVKDIAFDCVKEEIMNLLNLFISTP